MIEAVDRELEVTGRVARGLIDDARLDGLPVESALSVVRKALGKEGIEPSDMSLRQFTGRVLWARGVRKLSGQTLAQAAAERTQALQMCADVLALVFDAKVLDGELGELALIALARLQRIEETQR